MRITDLDGSIARIGARMIWLEEQCLALQKQVEELQKSLADALVDPVDVDLDEQKEPGNADVG